MQHEMRGCCQLICLLVVAVQRQVQINYLIGIATRTVEGVVQGVVFVCLTVVN